MGEALDRQVDPVVLFDSMWDAAGSLFGSYVWLERHAATPQEAENWWQMALAVDRERDAVDPYDPEAQRAALASFTARWRDLRPLILL